MSLDVSAIPNPTRHEAEISVESGIIRAASGLLYLSGIEERAGPMDPLSHVQTGLFKTYIACDLDRREAAQAMGITYDDYQKKHQYVLDRHSLTSMELLARMVGEGYAQFGFEADIFKAISSMTELQKAVLQQSAMGLTGPKIAQELDILPSTSRNILKRLPAMTGTAGRPAPKLRLGLHMYFMDKIKPEDYSSN
jgi:hypothetical protein